MTDYRVFRDITGLAISVDDRIVWAPSVRGGFLVVGKVTHIREDTFTIEVEYDGYVKYGPPSYTGLNRQSTFWIVRDASQEPTSFEDEDE